MADKFYVMLLTNGEDLFGEKNDQIIDYLLQYEWLNVKKIK